MTTIGITMGCPAGIGPEILLRYLAECKRPSSIVPIVLGDLGILNKCAKDLSLKVPLVNWQPGDSIPLESIAVFNLTSLPPHSIRWGFPDKTTGEAMACYIEAGIKLAKDGIIDALTTNPICKATLNEAGYNYPGHTEMLADLTDSKEYCMMMAGSRLRVTLVTIHCPLGDVATSISSESVAKLIATTDQALKIDFGIKTPKIAVAALNPHAGENLLFGQEEEQIIEPAIAIAKKQMILASGPYPPDTIFYKAVSGEFDAVVCMYHDQGLIPFKLIHFEDGVNITLGLPIIRTSVDHGTAYDIAGKGVASFQSLSEAVKLAALISFNRKTYLSIQISEHD